VITNDQVRDRRASAFLVALALVVVTVPTFIGRGGCIAEGGGRRGAADWCYTEISRLFVDEELTDGRLPFIDSCTGERTGPCDEYPVLTMYPMWLAAAAGGTILGDYYVAAFLLFAAAAVTTWLLWRLVRLRALYFAAAPTLLLYGPMNWDLIAVAAMTTAAYLFIRGRPRSAGIAAGIGVAAKAIPGVACAPMSLARRKDGGVKPVVPFIIATLISWLALNLPFAAAGWAGWTEFFRFNSARPVDIDSLWAVGCRALEGRTTCVSGAAVDPMSLAVFVCGVILVWRMRTRVEPTTPPWTMGFAMLAIFFLTNKVYSPQYDLFLLPWFALVVPDVRAFIAFEAAGVAIFLTRFRGFMEPSPDLFHVAVILRAVVLILCIAQYVREKEVSIEPLEHEDASVEHLEAI
jgi:hypothetical protein